MSRVRLVLSLVVLCGITIAGLIVIDAIRTRDQNADALKDALAQSYEQARQIREMRLQIKSNEREMRALRNAIKDMGGDPAVIVRTERSTSPPSPRPSPKSSPRPSPRSSPSPSGPPSCYTLGIERECVAP